MQTLFDAIRAADSDAIRSIVHQHPQSLTETAAGVTPLLMTLYTGRPDLAQLLLDLGAPVGFHEACALGDREQVLTLLETSPGLLNQRSADGFPPVGLAIFFGQGELARELVQRGADVNAVAENPQKVAPLHAAVAVCDRQTLQLLLERGADPNARQQSDFTPLHGAASRGDVEAAQLLLSHGAEPSARTADGMNAADIARKYGREEFARWFESR